MCNLQAPRSCQALLSFILGVPIECHHTQSTHSILSAFYGSRPFFCGCRLHVLTSRNFYSAQCGTTYITVYSILRLRMWEPAPVAQVGDQFLTATGPTAHLAAPPFPGPGHAGRLPKIQCGPHARVRASLSLCDPAASLARRCRGGDISRMCLADRNQCICPAAPEPRVTPCAPWPARRACLAVSRIRIPRAHIRTLVVVRDAARWSLRRH